MSPFFECELTAIPTSLFKHCCLRKTDQAQLAKCLKISVELLYMKYMFLMEVLLSIK